MLLALALASVAGCSSADDVPTGLKAPTSGSSFNINPMHSDGMPKTQDEIFAEIATVVPGYAGSYYDVDGTPTTNLVDLGKAADAEQATAFMTKGGRNGEGPRKSKFKKVAFDFLTLKKWKSIATKRLLAEANVAFVDIDEQNNRLDIGVYNAAGSANAQRFMRENDIPLGTLTLVPVDTSPGYTQNPGAGAETLRNTRSLYGGVEIRPQGVAQCSLGFNAMLSASDLYGNIRLYSYDHFFVTAAHCMSSLGYPSNTPINSAIDQTGATRLIGYEFRQPPWEGQETYYDCPAGSRCSTAEAALVRYVVPWGGARIARTTFPGSFGSDTGSVTLDPFNQPWPVTDSVMDFTLLSGATLYKVGRRTGWTQGTVSQTCVDWRLTINGYPSQFVALCQWTASTQAGPGDSGGSIFKYKLGYYPSVQVVGNLWGGNSAATTFSFFPYISYELTRRDAATGCGGGYPGGCYPRMTVSMN
jgi:hypothetical protein